MRKGVLSSAALVMAAGILLALPASASAAGDAGTEKIGQLWLAHLDPSLQIPDDLALRFGRAALSQGLTKGQALAMLNDQRFASAVGSPGQGYGLLEAMIENPEYIQKARELLADPGYSAAGADSIQTALMDVVPELRNAYLKDLGLMAVEGPSGVLVLVDLKTGRQYIGQGKLGTQLRAPGGGPLPSPSISPEQAAAAMWAQVGLAADGTTPLVVSPEPGGLWKVPGEDPGNGLLASPFVYIGAGLFLFAWAGYAVKAAARRFRAE